MVTFELRGESYRFISKEGLDLSDEAKAALMTATRSMGKTERRVACSDPVAQEMQNWFKDHAREYLPTARHQHKGRVCREAAQVIERVLAPEADATSGK